MNDLTQAVVELPKGKFSGGMGSQKASENFGLLGAIVVTPEGVKYFFKLTGPSATIKAARKPFYAMLDSMHMEGSKPGGAAAEGAPAAAAGSAGAAATSVAASPAPGSVANPAPGSVANPAPSPPPSGAAPPAGEAAAVKK